MNRSQIDLRGPLVSHASGFQSQLRRLGYTASAAKKHSYLLAHLSRWLDEQGLDMGDVATPRVEPFFEARRAAGFANLRTRKSLAPLIAYLHGLGVLPDAELPAPSSEAERLLQGFSTYLRCERGVVEGTVRFYVHVARLLISERVSAGGMDLAGLSVHDVTAFMTRVCEGRGLSSCRQVASALRSFLRYLQLEGVTDMALDNAVLCVAGWNPSLPRAASSESVARLVASCDRRRVIGRRDYAILLLLARLGLRGGEVVAIQLGDIDWYAGEVGVRGKGRRPDRLPLSAEVGQAVAAYLQRGRPTAEAERCFCALSHLSADLPAPAPFAACSPEPVPGRGLRTSGHTGSGTRRQPRCSVPAQRCPRSARSWDTAARSRLPATPRSPMISSGSLPAPGHRASHGVLWRWPWTSISPCVVVSAISSSGPGSCSSTSSPISSGSALIQVTVELAASWAMLAANPHVMLGGPPLGRRSLLRPLPPRYRSPPPGPAARSAPPGRAKARAVRVCQGGHPRLDGGGQPAALSAASHHDRDTHWAACGHWSACQRSHRPGSERL